jgi:putative PIN family toxin of toxin-antitoxin system
MRVVLDTNVLCSALITPGGLTDRLYQAWREKRFELITCEEQLEEFRRVTRYPRLKPFIEPAAAGAMLNELRRLALTLTRLPSVDRSRDPADNYPLAMAQAGEADALVTGDKHDLLALGEFGRTRILTTRQLLQQLGDENKPPLKRGGARPQRRSGRRTRSK